jgi:hypothetical protein
VSRQPTVGCGDGLLRLGQHFTTRAVTGIRAILGDESVDRRRIDLATLGLSDDIAVVTESQRGEVVERGRLVLGPGRNPVEVLDTHHEPPARRTSGEPRDERGAQVPEMQCGRRTRRESSVGHQATALRVG